MKVEEMFVLMDGTQADPNDVSRGEDGVWRHRNGVAVAMHADGRPETVGDRAALNARAASAGVDHKDDRRPVEVTREREADGEKPDADQHGSDDDAKPQDDAPVQ